MTTSQSIVDHPIDYSRSRDNFDNAEIREDIEHQPAVVRKLALMRYENKRDNVGKLNTGTIEQVYGLLAKRDIRRDKDGKAFSPNLCLPGMPRSKASVLACSMAVADVDDGTSLDELMPAIAAFSWFAYSSHSHTAGHPKFRIVFPLSRDYTPADHPAVWEGMNGLLKGHCDPACKDASRLYFLPSCPPETADDAFSIRNDGELIDPEHLMNLAHGAPKIIPLKNEFAALVPTPTPLAEIPENIVRVESMLAVLDPDPYPAGEGRNRVPYRNTVWSIADLDWDCGYEMARAWAMRGDLFDPADFDAVWHSYRPDGGIHFGTLAHYAKDAGWVEPKNVEKLTHLRETLNDAGNGDRIIAAYGDHLAHVADQGRWLIRYRGRWKQDKKNQISGLATAVIRGLYREAEKCGDPDQARALANHAGRSLQLSRIEAAVKLAATAPEIAVTSDQLDADNFLLGVRNGVLDLRTGTLRDEQREDWITREARVDYYPMAKCPQWLAFLNSIMAGDRDLIDFLQVLAGYGLTGDTTEQKFFFFYGSGANGKSTYLNTLREMMGGYAVQARPETLMQAKTGTQANGHTADIMPLIGARFAAANETEEGQRLAEALIKQLTGGEPMMVRSPYGRESTLVMPQFKVIMAGNHRPIIRGTDHGIWRRLVCVPFTVTIPDAQQDKKLMEKLRGEFPGILNWALEGCLQWRAKGLSLPPRLIGERQAYMTEMDVLQRWIDETCEIVPGHAWGARNAYSSYRLWAEGGGYGAVSETRFGPQLEEKGFSRVRKAQGSMIVGLKPRQGGLGQ